MRAYVSFFVVLSGSARFWMGVPGLNSQCNSLHYQLHRKVLSIGRHAVLECRLDCIVFPELVDQIPEDFLGVSA